MHIRQTLAIAVFATAIGGLIVPALAQNQGTAGSAPDQGMHNDMGMGHMGHGMMGGGMMGGGMMQGGCGDMMQSMNGGGRPNSQWQTHPPGSATPD